MEILAKYVCSHKYFFMQKKVVIALPNNSSYFPGLKRAFNYLGWESYFFDFRKFSLKEKYLLIVTKNQKQAITADIN